MKIDNNLFNTVVEKLKKEEENRIKNIENGVKRGCEKCTHWNDYFGCFKCKRCERERWS